MSRRERILAVVVIGLIGLFVLDQFVVRPLASRYEQLRAQADDIENELHHARVLLDNRNILEQRWDRMAQGGLNDDASAQRIEVQQRLSRWAEESGFNLATVSAAQTIAGAHFDEVRFLASGSGSLRAVAGFMARLERSDYPLRVIESDVTSRSDRGDDLALRLTLSTIRRGERSADDRAVSSAARVSEFQR